MNLKGIQLTWLGHATFRIVTPGGRTVIIDPWIMNNPACPPSEKKVKHVDVLLITHGHGDHIGDQLVYGGEACGYVVEFENGVKIYHAGDTNVFGDMAIIRELYAPEIAMLPIGDHFTMGPREAAYACNLLKPETVIPMHFGTFPVLTGSPAELHRLSPGLDIVTMKPGVTLGI